MINKGQLYNVVKQITPPIILDSLKKTRLFFIIKKYLNTKLKLDNSNPTWNEISAGFLKGRKMFLDKNGVWSPMLTGKYDDFFFTFLKTLDLNGKVVYDIGAHIGYSSLGFAQLVGPSGKVFAFEPNSVNRARFEKILSENKDLSGVIKIYDVGISKEEGEEEFVFSDNVDNGTSSGSFIESSDTFFAKNLYEKEIGFQRTKVRLFNIDSLSKIGITDKPALIKIDIEGAESMALEGAHSTLLESKPILLLEIHSIFNMFRCYEILNGLGYNITLLNKEDDGRCFVSAIYKK